MKRQFLSIPVLVAALILGIYIVPYNPTAGVRGFLNAFVAAVKYDRSSSRSLPVEVYGRYGTPGNAVIEINRHVIWDRQQDKYYAYRVISRANDGKSFLIEVMGVTPGSNLRQYEYLEFNDSGWMAYFGYRNMDDYDYGRSDSSGSLDKLYF